MALWSHGKSPDTTTSKDYARAYQWAEEREKEALKRCNGCKHLSKIQFNLRDMYICNGLTSHNPSSRAIASVIEEKKCAMEVKK